MTPEPGNKVMLINCWSRLQEKSRCWRRRCQPRRGLKFILILILMHCCWCVCHMSIMYLYVHMYSHFSKTIASYLNINICSTGNPKPIPRLHCVVRSSDCVIRHRTQNKSPHNESLAVLFLKRCLWFLRVCGDKPLRCDGKAEAVQS